MAQGSVNLTVFDSIMADLYSGFRAMNQTKGYNFNWGRDAIVGPVGDGFPFRKRNPVMGVVPGPEDSEEITGTVVRHCVRDVGIEAWADVDKRGGDNEEDRTRQMLHADIEKAVMGTPTSTTHTRGGYASDTQIITRQPIQGGGREVGVVVRLRIIYRHAVGDLYTKL